MTKKKTGRSLAAAKPASPAIPRRFAIADTEIRPEQFCRIAERHPSGQGPWSDEPDKLAWTDPGTGLPCIILRASDGTLGGYVGISPGHSLWGFEHDAVPADLEVSAHRGLDYSQLCERGGPEVVRICHVGFSSRGRAGPDQQDVGEHDDAWWFGFGCDKPGDLVPDGHKPPLHREEGEVYRGIDYVFEETRALARSLRAIEDGSDRSGGVPLVLGAPKLTSDKA